MKTSQRQTLSLGRIGLGLGVIRLLALTGTAQARTIGLTRQGSLSCQPDGGVLNCAGHATVTGPRGHAVKVGKVTVLTPLAPPQFRNRVRSVAANRPAKR